MANRIAAAIEDMQSRIDELDEETRKHLESNLGIDFQEHFAYQQAQARAHAGRKLTVDEAQIVYKALGGVYSASNEGWADSATLAHKVIVTRLMAEIL